MTDRTAHAVTPAAAIVDPLDDDHPAVQAAARAALAAGWTCDTHEPLPWGECPDCTESHLRTARRALAAALPQLDAVRDTCRAQVERRDVALEAVLELHTVAPPVTAAYGTLEGGDYCRTCAEDWPCQTVAAIVAAVPAPAAARAALDASTPERLPCGCARIAWED